MNELIFIAHIIILSLGVLGALLAGPQALICIMTILDIAANLFVTKQITLFGLNVTASDAYAVGATLCIAMLQEYYGNLAARQAIMISFATACFFLICSAFHLTYIPNRFDTCHPHFVVILRHLPRILIASLTSFALCQIMDYTIFAHLKKQATQLPLVMRYWIATIVSQTFDTVLFSILGLRGLVDNIGTIIMVSLTIKLAIIALHGPFVYWSSIIMKKVHA